jgi:predicted porin
VLDVNLFAKLDFAFFNQSELNTDDQLLRLASTYSTERSIWALDAELDRDSTRTSELTDTGNFDDISRRFRYSILPSWTAIITPRNRLRLNAGYTDVSYDTSTLSDYTYVTGGATWLHEYTEKTELNLRLTGGHYEANDTNSESDVIAFLVGATHSFSPKLKISGSIGPSYLSTESPTQSEDSVGLQFAGSAEYLLNERTSFLGSIERAISPSGGGAPIERDTIKFSGKHQFHPRWSLLFTATYIHNDESTSSGQDGRDYVSIEPTARYQLSQNFDLSASYRYRRQEIGDGLEAHSNAAFITLTYRAMPWVFGN